MPTSPVAEIMVRLNDVWGLEGHCGLPQCRHPGHRRAFTRRLEGRLGRHTLRLLGGFKNDALPKPPLADRDLAEVEPAEEPGEHEGAGPQHVHPVAVHARYAAPVPLSLDEEPRAEGLDVDGRE